MEVDPDQLREAVESQHGGRAHLVEAPPVEVFEGETVWSGVVHVSGLWAYSASSLGVVQGDRRTDL